MVSDPVLPSSNEFFDELEALKASRRPVEIIFRSENGARTVIRDRIAALTRVSDAFKSGIATLKGAEGQEWVRTGSGLDIPVDRLEQVDGIIRSKLS
jgi:hypothetical protein